MATEEICLKSLFHCFLYLVFFYLFCRSPDLITALQDTMKKETLLIGLRKTEYRHVPS